MQPRFAAAFATIGLCVSCTSSRNTPFVEFVAIDPQTEALVLDAVARVTSQAPDMPTLRYYRRHSGEQGATLQTQRARQPDGALRWQLVYCGQKSSRRHWQCFAQQQRALRMDAQADVPAYEVGLTDDIDGELARAAVSAALDGYFRGASLPDCETNQVIASTDAARAEMRSDLGVHVVKLSRTPDEFSLEVGTHELRFDFDAARQPAARLRCSVTHPDAEISNPSTRLDRHPG